MGDSCNITSGLNLLPVQVPCPTVTTEAGTTAVTTTYAVISTAGIAVTTELPNMISSNVFSTGAKIAVGVLVGGIVFILLGFAIFAIYWYKLRKPKYTLRNKHHYGPWSDDTNMKDYVDNSRH